MTARMSLASVALIAVGAAAIGVSFPAASARAIAQVRPDSREALDAIIKEEVGDASRSNIQRRLAVRTPQGPVPRTSWDGKPDFNGVYYPYVDVVKPPVPLESLYRPEVQALRKKLHREITPNQHCYPEPPLSSFTPPHPIQIFHGPGTVVIINEQFGNARVIPIVDGPPKHNPSVRPSFQGDAVGHWEGDTLVVDVTNFNGRNWLFDPLHLTSDALHIVERWTRPDALTVENEGVVEDPKMLTAPWKSALMRRGQLKHDFSSFDPCFDDSAELALTLAAIKAPPAQVQLSKDALLYGAHVVLEREAAKGTK